MKLGKYELVHDAEEIETVTVLRCFFFFFFSHARKRKSEFYVKIKFDHFVARRKLERKSLSVEHV